MAGKDSLDSIEKALGFGINGVPEIKKEEREMFLGELRERVVRAITFDRLDDPTTKWELKLILGDTRVKKIVLRQDISRKILDDYIEILKQAKIPFSLVDSPSYKSEIVLLAVSDAAVDVKDIFVSKREKNMLSRGIHLGIIRNIGSKLCNDCWGILNNKAPEELSNYEKSNFFDKICGFECIACKE